jgi:hypothetical protein
LKGAKKTLNLQGLQDYVGDRLGFVPKSDFSLVLDAAFSFPDRVSLDAGRMFLFASNGKHVWHEHPRLGSQPTVPAPSRARLQPDGVTTHMRDSSLLSE